MIPQLLTVLCFVAASWAAEPYDGYKVLEIVPRTDEQLHIVDVLSKLDNVISGDHTLMNKENYLTVPPTLMRFVQQKLHQHKLTFKVIYDDLQEVIDRQRAVMYAERNEFDFDIYNSLEAIYEQLNVWYTTCPKNLSCDLYNIGRTYEGVDIKAYKIGSATGTNNAILAMSLIHAREWISGATVMKIIDHMTNGYGVDDEVTRMLDTYDFYIIPVDNPDGYNRSTTTNRMQRKNLTPNDDSNCLGTDLNRNNDYLWGEEGVHRFPCSDLYCGPSGGSELETQAYNNEVFRIQNEQTLWSIIDFHNYGQMWMHPWGNTENHEGDVCERAEDHDEMYHIAEVTAQAIMRTHNTDWAYGTSCEVIYETTGATDDWAKGVAGVKYPFNPELRGTGFVTEEEDIQLSFEEIWNGLVAMTDEITIVHELSGNNKQ